MLAACTIVSKNYLAYARVLAQSFLAQVPEGRFFVLLVDRNQGKIDPAAEVFELVEAEELGNVPSFAAFIFKYTLLEANTAIKPYFLEYLIEKHRLDNLIYFDPDILILGSLDELGAQLERHSLVLTPHLLDPIDDAAYPGEQAILISGSYNLGFIALRVDEISRRFLRWWQTRLYDKCLVRVAEGLFTDQKWIDLVPGLFKDVEILVDPGYNVAYWNLNARRVEKQKDGTFLVNGRPLVFFHFSGIQPESLEGVSKHQNRYRLADIGDAALLYEHYRDLVFAAGHKDCKPWPYAFGSFSNGVAIPEAARNLFYGLSEAERQAFGDPFVTEGPRNFFAWLNDSKSGKASPYLSRLLAFIHAQRPDLVAAYPDPSGSDFAPFSGWMLGFGRHEMKLPEIFVKDLFRPSPIERFGPESLSLRLTNRLRRIYHSPQARKVRELVKTMLGAERLRALKRRWRPPRVAPVHDPNAAPAKLKNPGINLIGYLRAETGMGQAARQLAQAIAAAGLPLSLHNLDLGVVARSEDATFGPAESNFQHDINLFVVNADQVPHVFAALGPVVTVGRINIGYWLWELEDFPARFRDAFSLLDEVWTPTSFCVDAIGRRAPIPVKRLPFPIERRPTTAEQPQIRARLGLPADVFLVVFVFNYLSYFERKNPLAAVAAFRQAFGDDPTKRLLIKTAQHDFAPEDHARLVAATATLANVSLVTEYLDRAEVDALIADSDVYLSLHRSEGFGLTLAEAMIAGTPVISTTYSAPRDFFDANNGFPVQYELVTLTEDAGPYPRGSRWADPDVADAARQLRQVVEDQAEVVRRVERGRRDLERDYSAAAIARRIQEQVDELIWRLGKELRPPGA